MEDSKKVTVTLDVDTALALDELLRDGLVASGALSAEDNASVRPLRVTLNLDDKTAAKFSELLRNGLIEASSAHQANNNNLARAMKKIIDSK